MGRIFSNQKLYEGAQKAAHIGQSPPARSGTIHRLPGKLAAWTDTRDLKPVPEQTFRDWWKNRESGASSGGSEDGAS